MHRDFGGPERWQAFTTQEWLDRLATDPDGAEVYVLDGQTRPSFVFGASTRIREVVTRVVLLDRAPDVRHARLAGPRGQPELSNSHMDSWAAYLRGQADAPRLPIIDTTNMGLVEVVDALARYVETVRTAWVAC